MPTYYIDKCERVKEFQNKYGNTMVLYKLLVKNEEGTFEAEILQRPETEVPSGTIKGTIESGPYGNKFKKEKVERQGNEYVSGRSPEERSSIIRQHSQQMAVMWGAVLDKHGGLPLDEGGKIESKWLPNAITWFQMDAENAGKHD